MSIRRERLNSFMVQEVSAIIRSLKDPRLGSITVTQANVSPDLRSARGGPEGPGGGNAPYKAKADQDCEHEVRAGAEVLPGRRPNPQCPHTGASQFCQG